MQTSSLLWKAWHYTHSLETRFFQRLEWSLLRQAGIPISDRVYKEIWSRPGDSEDWVNLARFLPSGSPVFLIDVGANVGDFTMRAMQEYPGLQAVCFEPVKANFDELSKRYGANPNVTLHHAAASVDNTDSTIFLGRSNTLFSLEKYSTEGDAAYGIEDDSYQTTETIQCRRLDSYEFEPGDRRVLLKVDVQGHEVKALDGAAGILSMVDVAIVECSFANEYEGLPPSFSGVTAQLAAAKLYPVVFQDYGRTWSNYAFERDVIFVREPQLKNIWFQNYGVKKI